jgi:hypothetical protein
VRASPAAQKHDLAFYVGRVPDAVRERMKAAGFGFGNGAVHFRRMDPEKAELLRSAR